MQSADNDLAGATGLAHSPGPSAGAGARFGLRGETAVSRPYQRTEVLNVTEEREVTDRAQSASASALCVLILCFDGAKRAAQIRRPLSKQLGQQGSAILDAAIIRVDGEGKARVHDPQRTLPGMLTAALTWGCSACSPAG